MCPFSAFFYNFDKVCCRFPGRIEIYAATFLFCRRNFFLLVTLKIMGKVLSELFVLA
jgi:hypothetical protein